MPKSKSIEGAFQDLYLPPHQAVADVAQTPGICSLLHRFAKRAEASRAIEVGWTVLANRIVERVGDAVHVKGYHGEEMVLYDLHSHPTPPPFRTQVFPSPADLIHSVSSTGKCFARSFLQTGLPPEVGRGTVFIGWQLRPLGPDEFLAARESLDREVEVLSGQQDDFEALVFGERGNPQFVDVGVAWMQERLPSLELTVIELDQLQW